MACVLDTDNKVGSHCGLSVVGIALTFTRWGNPLPYAWTVLFQGLPPRRHNRGHLRRLFWMERWGTVISWN